MGNKRKCKCVVTGEYGTVDTFVKIDNQYYKSQEIYEEDRHKKETYRELIDYICREFLGYYAGQPFIPALPRRLKELDFYDYDVILETFKHKTKEIRYALDTKQFATDVSKLNYIFAIVKNSIGDVYKYIKVTEKQEKHHTLPQVEMDIEINNIGAKVVGKNISNWLEADEL